jgi:hypothetical protein
MLGPIRQMRVGNGPSNKEAAVVKAQASIMIAQPPQQIYDFVAVDFARNYQRWSPEVQRLDMLTPGPLRVGSRARQVRLDRGRRSDTTFRVIALDPPQRVGFAESTDKFRIFYRIDPVGSDTRLTFTFELKRMELHMRPFEKLIRVTVREGATRVVRNIKLLVEQGGRRSS